MLTKEKVETKVELGVADRCDRCYAQAQYRATKLIDEKIYVLLFCGHHNREYGPALIIQGFAISN